MFLIYLKKHYLFFLGILTNGVVSLLYFLNGYSLYITLLWLISIAILGIYFFRFKKGATRNSNFDVKDLYVIGLLLFIFIPIYLTLNYFIPIQVNTDEPTIMFFSIELLESSNPDLFGLSNYFNYPSLVFIIFGWLANMLGEINLLYYRIVHASFGIIIILISYLFFRLASQQLITTNSIKARVYAIGGAILVGSNHTLIAVSRMAMRDNSALLIEIAALTILLFGLLKKDIFYIFLGGLITGLSFYVYLPARITIVLWFMFLTVLFIFLRKKYPLLELIKYGFITLIGAFIIISPLIVASITAQETEFTDIRHKLLLFPEARTEQQAWINAPSIFDGIKKNTIQGLTAFNRKIHDHNYIYFHPGHGFVDPLTGILIWVGLLSIIINIVIYRDKKEIYFLGAGSFLLIWLTLSFFFTKNPHYNRLLSLLPFISFLVIEALRNAGDKLNTLVKYYFPKIKSVETLLFIGTIILIFVFNLSIFGKFVKKGIAEGNDVGGVARYVETRANQSPYAFYLVASHEYAYYSWGDAWQWDGWLNFFINEWQTSRVLNPDTFLNELPNPPFTLFMNNHLWEESRATINARYPQFKLINITTDGRRLAVEIE